MRLLKRQEIIEAWNKQNEETKNSFCCPGCRDILYYNNDRNIYQCLNDDCNIKSLIIGNENGENFIKSIKKEKKMTTQFSSDFFSYRFI